MKVFLTQQPGPHPAISMRIHGGSDAPQSNGGDSAPPQQAPRFDAGLAGERAQQIERGSRKQVLRIVHVNAGHFQREALEAFRVLRAASPVKKAGP